MADQEDESNEVVLTAAEKAALDRLMAAGLTDPKRLKTLVDLVDASQAWGWFRKFVIQLAVSLGSLTGIVTTILLLREWFNQQ